MIHEGSDPSSIGVSINYLLEGLDPKNPKTGADLITQDTNGVVDARDVAAIHADVLAVEEAGNERYLTVSRLWNWQDVYNGLNEPPAFENVHAGQPDVSKTTEEPAPMSSKLLNALDRRQAEVFRPLNLTVRDTVADAKANRAWAL